MFGFFKRKKSTEETEEPQNQFDESIGVSTESDRQYREERFEMILSNVPVEEQDNLKGLLDSWVIETLEQTTGLSDRPTTVFLPRPLWDAEAVLARQTFPTEDSAKQYVLNVGGKLA